MALPPIVKNYLTVSTGVVFGQALSMLAMPVLSRYYSSENFGVFGTFLSIASILSSLATLQYGVALMLPKRDTEAANVFVLGCLSVVALTAVVSIFLVAFPDLSREIIKAPANTFLLLLPLYILFNGSNQMLIGWSVRRKQFKQNSVSQISRSLTVNSVQIAAAPTIATGGVLAVGAVLGEFTSCLNLAIVLWRQEKRFFHKCLSSHWMKKLAKSYYDFPAFATPQNLLNAISQGLPVLLLGHYYGVQVAGLYAFGIRLVQGPMGLLLNPLRQVLFQKFCEIQNQGGSVLPVFRKCTLGLLLVIVIPMTAGLFFFPSLFALLFGEAWRRSGEFSRWLLVWQAFMFCNLPSVLMSRILRMQRQMLFFDVVTLGLRTTVLVLGGLFLGDEQSVAAFCLLGALLNLVLIAWIWRRLNLEAAPAPKFLHEARLA